MQDATHDLDGHVRRRVLFDARRDCVVLRKPSDPTCAFPCKGGCTLQHYNRTVPRCINTVEHVACNSARLCRESEAVTLVRTLAAIVPPSAAAVPVSATDHRRCATLFYPTEMRLQRLAAQSQALARLGTARLSTARLGTA